MLAEILNTLFLKTEDKIEPKVSFHREIENYYTEISNNGIPKELLTEIIEKVTDKIYDDYKRVNNLLMPFRIESSSPKKDGDFTMILNKIEINKAFPANTFKF